MKERIFLIILLMTICFSPSAMCAQRDSSFCRVKLPKPIIFMQGYADYLQHKWQEIIPQVTVIEGITEDAAFVKRLRAQGKILAYHVNLAHEKTEQLGFAVAVGLEFLGIRIKDTGNHSVQF